MSSGHDRTGYPSDAARAVRFLVVKAAIFIGIPIIASAIAVIILLN